MRESVITAAVTIGLVGAFQILLFWLMSRERRSIVSEVLRSGHADVIVEQRGTHSRLALRSGARSEGGTP
ncbi:hypothetical protein GCM10009716_18970 [Streptomyces sodiiphilus]|uniref:Uncharacterized protein n=1 Tax=Streptomyces sodiiphilus TaxID=226217 RepID=A0ABN2P1T9_9ACTN